MDIGVTFLAAGQGWLVALATLAHVVAILAVCACLVMRRRCALWLARARAGAGDRRWPRLLERALRAALATALFTAVIQPRVCDLLDRLSQVPADDVARTWRVVGFSWLQWPLLLATAVFMVWAASRERFSRGFLSAIGLVLLGTAVELARGFDTDGSQRIATVAISVLLAAITTTVLGVFGAGWARVLARAPASRVTLLVLVGLLGIMALPAHPLAPLTQSIQGIWQAEGGLPDQGMPGVFCRCDRGQMTWFHVDLARRADAQDMAEPMGPGEWIGTGPPYRYEDRWWCYEYPNGRRLVRALRLRPWFVGWWDVGDGQLEPLQMPRRPMKAVLDAMEQASRAAARDLALTLRDHSITLTDRRITVAGSQGLLSLEWNRVQSVVFRLVPLSDPPVVIVELSAGTGWPLTLPSNATGFRAFVEAAPGHWRLDVRRWESLIANPGGPSSWTLAELR